VRSGEDEPTYDDLKSAAADVEANITAQRSKRGSAMSSAKPALNFTETLASFYLPEDITVLPTRVQSYLFKQGATRKSWKWRWFVLDSDKGNIRYFENAGEGAELKGEIALDTVSGAETAPELDAEGFFYFNVRRCRHSNRTLHDHIITIGSYSCSL
jgi:hypothetical protein